MKQIYKKPQLHIEYFSLSQSIAAGCGAVSGGNSLGQANHWDKETCGWKVGSDVYWAESSNACIGDGKIPDEYADMPGVVEGVCYNNPEGGNSIFSS